MSRRFIFRKLSTVGEIIFSNCSTFCRLMRSFSKVEIRVMPCLTHSQDSIELIWYFKSFCSFSFTLIMYLNLVEFIWHLQSFICLFSTLIRSELRWSFLGFKIFRLFSLWRSSGLSLLKLRWHYKSFTCFALSDDHDCI